MPFRLRPHLSWCVCGHRVVFLDLAEDRYFCLPMASGEAFIRLAQGVAGDGDLQMLKPLVEMRLVVAAPKGTGIEPACSAEPAARDILDNDFPAEAIPLGLLEMFTAELRAGYALRRRSLLQIVEAQARTDGSPSAVLRNCDQRLREIATASHRMSLILRATNRCLVRALAVHQICRARGLRPKLLFGVRMDPFGGHAWVQVGDSVVVGDYEQVRLYTPILAVG